MRSSETASRGCPTSTAGRLRHLGRNCDGRRVRRRPTCVDVRLAAGRALGQLGGDDAVAALRPALDDPDPALQYRAMQSLREITGKDFGDNVVSWREYVRGEGAPAEISLVDRMKLQAF